MFIANKKSSFLSLNFKLNLNLETINRLNIKNGINIPICLVKNISGYFK